MKVSELAKNLNLTVLIEGDHWDSDITVPACCDLLSVAMGTLPEGCAWVTVMSNINTLAVASLTDAACVILALKTAVEDNFLAKAEATGITVLRSPDHIFDTALKVYKQLENN